MIKTQNTMVSLVNSVRPMAHSHSSVYSLQFTHVEKQSIKTLFPISQSTWSASHRLTQQGYIDYHEN